MKRKIVFCIVSAALIISASVLAQVKADEYAMNKAEFVSA